MPTAALRAAVHRTPYPPGASMTGPNNPLSEYPRRDLRGSLPGARSANTSRVDLLPTPSVGNDNDTSTSSTGGLFSYLGDEPSFVASRARDDAQGSLHGAHGEVHPRGAGGRLENRHATAPHDFRASTTRKTAPPPDAQVEQGTTTSRRSADEAAELLLAPALEAAATADPQRLRNPDGFTRLPEGLLTGRRYSHAASTARYDWSEVSRSGSARPLSTARMGGVADPEGSSASRIINGMRAASVSSVYPLPSVRSAQRAVQPPSADAMASSRRGVPDATLERPGTISHPAAGAVRATTRGDAGALRAPSRGGERAAAARAGARLAAGGDTWRAPAVAYNAVERRIGRDATALRAVSARLDAAATAIDAVEVGVRSASDSLDSLLHLLESRPVAAALSANGVGVVERSTPSSMPGDSQATAVADVDGVTTQAWGLRSTTGVRPTDAVSTGSSSSVARSAACAARGATAVAGGLSGGGVARTPPPPSSAERVVQGAVRPGVLPDANTAPAPASYRRGDDAGGESRTSLRVVQREPTVSTPPGDRLDGDGDAVVCAGHAAIASVQRGASARAELTARPTMVLKAEEDEPRPERDCGERFFSLSPSPEPSVAVQENSEAAGGSVAEQGQRGRDSLGGEARAGYPWRAGPAHAEAVPRADDDGVAEAATSGTRPFLPRGGGTPSEEDRSQSSGEELRSGRAVPDGSGTSDVVVQADSAAAGTAMNATREGRRRPARSDASLPVLELEEAMDGIDAERGRLILEIARLRGQQNESLIHLQRLQHEQVVVRQRQVSTLSDIVNSFGRTVEAAGALPHGEDSSLGRISGDVVSTLRRMLRLLSATVPVAAESGSRATSGSARVDLPLSPSLAPSAATDTLSVPARRPSEPATRATSRARSASASGTYAVGGRVALRPAGDLTQEVIDAALQALPRLAAAATAISGARRIQGFLAGEGGGEAGGDGAEGRNTGRRCSVETIAALPDASPSWEDGSGGGDGDGGGGSGGGVRGCVICLSEDSTAGQLLCHLPCDHVFHRVCVGKWLRVQDSCPTCRRQVPDVKDGVVCEAPAPEVA